MASEQPPVMVVVNVVSLECVSKALMAVVVVLERGWWVAVVIVFPPFPACFFAAAASAAVLPRGDQCCFQIYASGGVEGLMGQYIDGQNRINGSYAPETYCYSNGGITDAHGRGYGQHALRLLIMEDNS